MATKPNLHKRINGSPLIKTEGPRPLYRELPPPTEFPLGALEGILGSATAAIESIIECPLECAASSVLAVASLAAQGRANVVLPIGQGKLSPLSLYLMTVIESGERKSSADGIALKPVREYEHDLTDAFAADRLSYAIQQAGHEAASKQINLKNKNDRAALEAALRDLGPEPQPPLTPVLAPSGDQTMEGLFRVYQSGRPSLAMLCDDAASFLGGHSMKAEQRGGTTANLCRAWDGSKLERIRGGDGVTILYERRLACHLMVQPGVAAEFFSDPQFADQGLTARFLPSAPANRAGTRERNDAAYQGLARDAEFALAGYNEAVGRLLRMPVRWKNEHNRAAGVELDALHFTSGSRALYVEFANAIERQLGPSGSLVSVKAFASKLPENASRIAGILTLISDPNACAIQVETLANAIDVAKFYLNEMLRLAAVGAIDPVLRQAETLRKWLRAQGCDTIGLRQIYQYGPNAIRDAGSARSAMKVLEDNGWVKALPSGSVIDGVAHKEAWEIVSC